MVLKRINDKSLVLATRFAAQAMRILSTCVFARLVHQEEYGRFDMIVAVAGIFAAVADFGISRAVCNTPDLDDDEVRDTSLIMLIVMSLFFGALAVAGGWYFDRFYDDPRLRWIGIIVAMALICQYAMTAQLSFLARQLQFGRWVVIEFVSTSAAIATGVVTAIYGAGVFALALQQLAGQGSGLLLTFMFQPLRWPKRFSRLVAKRFFSFGWRITIYQSHYGLQVSLIRLMIFPRYGDIGVALYGRAWQMRELIGQNLTNTFEIILAPLIARGKEDANRLRDLFVRGNVAVLTFCALGAAALTAVVPDLVRVFLGRNWADVPELLFAMAPGLVVLGLTFPSIILAVALSDTAALIRYALSSIGVFALAAFVFSMTDLWTFTLSYSLLMVVPALLLVRWACRVTSVSVLDLIRRQLPIVAIASLTFMAMWLTRRQLLALDQTGESLLHALARLVVCGFVGLTTSWILFYVGDRQNYRDLLNLIVRGKETPITAEDAMIAMGPTEVPLDSGNG